MHLLVLSAFRLKAGTAPAEIVASQCTFWCSVLSDCKRGMVLSRRGNWSQCTFWCSVLSDNNDPHTHDASAKGSQCTFWCSVLSDSSSSSSSGVNFRSLNAPFGAQCFPTRKESQMDFQKIIVSMHLLVLSAFRPRSTMRRMQYP